MKLIRIGSFLFALVLFMFALVMAYLELRLLARKQLPSREDGRRVAKWGHRSFRWACALMRIKVKYDLPISIAPPASIVVSNHTSMFDVLACLAVADRLDMGLSWIVKRAVLDYPLIGWMARRQGCAAVHRDGRADDRNAVEIGARGALEAGLGLLIFVEGTRSAELQPPKPGGFLRARRIIPNVLSITQAWHPPLGIGGRGRTIAEGADLYGRSLLLHARHFAADETASDGWLADEWERKRALIADWRREKDAEAFNDAPSTA
jgi:1-acyl-sn-glycerol-3-phosphate acyltransferase